MPRTPKTTLLEDAIDIPIWLQGDAVNPLGQRMQRDREFGRHFGTAADSARVRGWWRQIDGRGEALPGRSLARTRAWISVALAVIGSVAGIGLALAAFAYDGTYPVNVVRLLALLVAPQVILIALNILLIPGRIPGLDFIQETLSAINPGALAAAVYRQVTRRPHGNVFGWLTAPSAAQRRFAKWQMLVWSQTAAVAFNLTVVATAAVLIAFTDLAFGWSTTVDISGATATRLFRAIAAPWAAIFPDAVPSAELVERSQFFRLDAQTALPDSRSLTGWWSYTVLAVIVYGLIPRCIFALLAGWRLHAATRAMLLNDSRVVALLDRMSAPTLESRGANHGQQPAHRQSTAAAVPEAALAGSASVVVWNQAVAPERTAEVLSSSLGLTPAHVVEAGAGSLDAELATITGLPVGSGPVVVLTPAWEPPLLDFVDFLGGLRKAIGVARSIVVVPVGDELQTITAQERENWSHAVAKAKDAHTYLEADAQ